MLVQSPVSFVLKCVGIITQTTVLGHLRSVSKGSLKKKFPKLFLCISTKFLNLEMIGKLELRSSIAEFL